MRLSKLILPVLFLVRASNPTTAEATLSIPIPLPSSSYSYSPSTSPRPSTHSLATHLIHATALTEFLELRSSQHESQTLSRLDWTSDGCSKSPDRPFGFDFLSCCYRHDFAYRNYRRQGRLNEDERYRIDVRFREDMRNICEKESATRRTVCITLAELYYTGIRIFGAERRRNGTPGWAFGGVKVAP
jgi:hypothetical protein